MSKYKLLESYILDRLVPTIDVDHVKTALDKIAFEGVLNSDQLYECWQACQSDIIELHRDCIIIGIDTHLHTMLGVINGTLGPVEIRNNITEQAIEVLSEGLFRDMNDA